MVSVTLAMPLTADGAVDTAAWCERITLAHQRLDQQQLLQAAQWLTGYGEDMLPQSLELAEMVAELRLDQSAVLAAMAYAGYRKGLFDEQVLVQSYGTDAAKLCVSVAALATSSLLEVSDTRMLAGEEDRQVENIKRMLVSLIQDFRVAVIKLAERVQALRYAKHYDEARQQRIAEEAASVFAPLANRMGMWQ
ncbi:MAG TPA: hypothetical protein DE147_13940, partial [Gammaproteobacteria bacterium]|nr:hypothetical protein [Gammaproteobacteria bacterium]